MDTDIFSRTFEKATQDQDNAILEFVRRIKKGIPDLNVFKTDFRATDVPGAYIVEFDFSSSGEPESPSRKGNSAATFAFYLEKKEGVPTGNFVMTTGRRTEKLYTGSDVDEALRIMAKRLGSAAAISPIVLAEALECNDKA